MQVVQIGNVALIPKTYQKQRVVTFKDIDAVHQRPEGTARKRFNDNQKRFIFGVDYFVRKTDEAKKEFGITAPNGLTLITESGYLMLVKSFTDDLAWKVQRELVNNYFRVKQEPQAVAPASTERLPHKYQYNGAPVWLTKELHALFPKNAYGSLTFLVKRRLTPGADYLLLEDEELAKFKSENTIVYPDPAASISSGIVVFVTGYDKLANVIPSSAEKTRNMVVDIPDNDWFQKAILEIRNYSTALDIALRQFNRYDSLPGYEAHKRVLGDLAMDLSSVVFKMLQNQPQLIANKK